MIYGGDYMWFLWILSVFFFIVGIAMIIKPVWFLELQDTFRTNSEVEYTEFAIGATRFSGICIIFFAIFIIFKLFIF